MYLPIFEALKADYSPNMSLKIIECPRDAMQGIERFIPTSHKIDYIQSLLEVGFHTLDFGSFVSKKAIPQMRDTREVLAGLDLSQTNTELLAIVANLKGAQAACEYPEIDYLGFPFSISETFQQRNTNSSIAESERRVEAILELCNKHGKELVIYISMGFGNPYGDDWNAEIATGWVDKMVRKGIKIISLSDTVGVATPESIQYLFEALIPAFPNVELGAHLHTRAESWKEKVEAAYNAGCHRFDGALKGFGGCPMATDHLTGNMPTENLIQFMREKDLEVPFDAERFSASMVLASKYLG